MQGEPDWGVFLRRKAIRPAQTSLTKPYHEQIWGWPRDTAGAPTVGPGESIQGALGPYIATAARGGHSTTTSDTLSRLL